MKRYKIITEYGVVSELSQRFDTSTKSVRKALDYRSRSEKAADIREAALREYHGQVIEIDEPIKNAMTDEVKRFVYANNGWANPTAKAERPKTGRLLYNGAELMQGAFALLNHKRAELLRTGCYQRNLFKITSLVSHKKLGTIKNQIKFGSLRSKSSLSY